MNTIFLNRYAHVHAGAHAKRGCENLGARIIFDGGHNIYRVRNTYIYIYIHVHRRPTVVRCGRLRRPTLYSYLLSRACTEKRSM